ncbi:MAG TPA: hypothetical protein VFS59_15410, partial [Gemmatimonadaceae bacterium]|nr:hypothetical protein [Gemmatimonadaceae bacterium]
MRVQLHIGHEHMFASHIYVGYRLQVEKRGHNDRTMRDFRGMDAAVSALVGAAIGALGSLLVPVLDADRRRKDQLRAVCADFSASLILMQSLSWDLPTLTGAKRNERLARISSVHEQAQVACEQLRLLSRSVEAQRAGRFALRHAWAIWRLAETGRDPRGHTHPPTDTPRVRFNRELHKL